ncbi:MAG: exodeoxyribonuclease VII small subunit [Phycisphaeraceae bacterium]|nr:exodeoxyribonuclease VII small subunit [Phycisphaeraceae bacterium]
MAKKPANKDATGLSFEDALSEVESIIDRIERGEVGLEASIGEFERGSRLVKRCREILGEAEQRVRRLSEELAEAEGPSESSPDD